MKSMKNFPNNSLKKIPLSLGSTLYTVPKIHKLDPPGRPIISGNGCPTEKISIFVDSFLQPLAMTLDSYVQDDIDLTT